MFDDATRERMISRLEGETPEEDNAPRGVEPVETPTSQGGTPGDAQADVTDEPDTTGGEEAVEEDEPVRGKKPHEGWVPLSRLKKVSGVAKDYETKYQQAQQELELLRRASRPEPEVDWAEKVLDEEDEVKVLKRQLTSFQDEIRFEKAQNYVDSKVNDIRALPDYKDVPKNILYTALAKNPKADLEAVAIDYITVQEEQEQAVIKKYLEKNPHLAPQQQAAPPRPKAKASPVVSKSDVPKTREELRARMLSRL